MDFIILFTFLVLSTLKEMFHKWRSPNTEKLSYSIIAVCHNESPRLPAFFASLDKLEYPEDLFEIILVDDASTDDSAEMIRAFTYAKENRHAYFITEKENHTGKRQALSLATSHASGDILLMTDSDTEVMPNWVDSYNHYFNSSIGMVIGYVKGRKLRLIARVKKIFSAGLFCAAIGYKVPFSCSGANFAIRRSVFEEVGGYDQLGTFQSGDDKLLLKKVHKSGERVAYNYELLVYEQDRPYTAKEYLRRELRHFGKFRQSAFLYQCLTILLAAFFIYLPYEIIKQGNLKAVFEVILPIYVFYTMSMIRHKEKFNIADYLFLPIYPYYVIFFTFIGTFKKATWKA